MNRRRFAEYPDVAEVIVTRRREDQSSVEEDEVKSIREDLKRANKQCELLKHKNERLKLRKKYLKKKVRHLEEIGVRSVEKATEPNEEKRFSCKKIVETVLRVIKGIAGLLNAVGFVFNVFKKSKAQYGAVA